MRKKCNLQPPHAAQNLRPIIFLSSFPPPPPPDIRLGWGFWPPLSLLSSGAHLFHSGRSVGPFMELTASVQQQRGIGIGMHPLLGLCGVAHCRYDIMLALMAHSTLDSDTFQEAINERTIDFEVGRLPM